VASLPDLGLTTIDWPRAPSIGLEEFLGYCKKARHPGCCMGSCEEAF
jgi:uncharacterized short protein YbdD (DUF466 family)